MTALRVRALAFAKVNWVLEVLGRRPDGYHEIRTVMQTIDLRDTLDMEPAAGLHLDAEGGGLPPPEENLVTKAACLLRERAAGRPGAAMRLSKRIPVAAGLGGGSSDAAACLRGLNKLWGLDLPTGELAAVAARLGSDVAFFLHGGPALAEGRGERITPLPDAPQKEVVIALPDLTIAEKTRSMYSLLTPADCTDGSAAHQLADALRRGEILRDDCLYNAFDAPTFRTYPELDRLRRTLLEAGARSVHLAGSGPAMFVLTQDPGQRELLVRVGIDAGVRVFTAVSMPAAEALALEATAG